MRALTTTTLALTVAAATVPLAGCETTHAPMTYERCRAANLCTMRGRMARVETPQAPMGQLDLADGRCVAVSLPQQMLLELQQQGATEVTVRGRVFEVERNSRAMTVEGRPIGLGLCGGDFILFVYD